MYYNPLKITNIAITAAKTIILDEDHLTMESEEFGTEFLDRVSGVPVMHPRGLIC